MDTIVEKLNKQANSLNESDLDWIIPDLARFYQSRIDAHALRVYGSDGGSVAREAFRETAKATLKNGLTTFLFRSRHWESGRDVNTYLLTCLKRLADQMFWDQSSAKRANVLVCPACREQGQKVFLVAEAKSWRCPNCTSEIERMQELIRKGLGDAKIRVALRTHKAFALHSRRGYRCPEPDCSRFIPESFNGKFGIECPYTNCVFFGPVGTLELMCHPSALTHRQMISLNQPLKNSNDSGSSGSVSLQDMFEAELVSPDDKISISQSFQREFSTMMSVIESQIASVKRMNGKNTRQQKLLMYEAFKAVCYQYSEEMVSYLCHRRQSSDVRIQPTIFQEYICQIENALPFTIDRRGERMDIMSISDPYLGLFQGISTFDATVDDNGKIPNNTIETYAGGRKFKMYGPCFIGKLISVVNKATGENLNSSIKSYSFIDLETGIVPGTEVKVTHYRILPHYEMGNMVFLQRIRKQIVNRIFRLLNGTKRVIRKSSPPAQSSTA